MSDLRGDSRWFAGLALATVIVNVALDEWAPAFMMGAVFCVLRGAQAMLDALDRADEKRGGK